ncbi:hypothetical protein [Catenuloplanes japonicus]|uniref:hypothetical protein n=1 Tax=Catenuloplanes japonicus TaxID=33876 RepID=UPI000527AFF8|nr:hypothetical protein [Catenuloplanes japonicus]
MARVAVPVTVITKAGVAPATEVNGDPVNAHSVANSGSTFIVARNNGVTPRTMTINLKGSVDGQPITARSVSVPASGTRYVGPFDTTRYGASLEVGVDHADVKLQAFRTA